MYKLTFKINKLITKKGLQILGSEFVRNNINKGKIIYKNKTFKLKEILQINNIKENELKIKMIINRNCFNINSMFENCKYLLNIIKSSNQNDLDENVNDAEISYKKPDYIFETIINSENSKTLTLHDYESEIKPNEEYYIDNIKHYIDKSKKEIYISSLNIRVFYNCQSLTSLPDMITNWNTEKVIDMGGIFFNCFKLTSLPDISNWNMVNVINMSGIFHSCSSLKSLPDISKWNTENVFYIDKMFYKCKNLTSLPNISKWNITKIIDMNLMFCSCSSLRTLPDISKWDTKNVIDMSGLFYNCEFL